MHREFSPKTGRETTDLGDREIEERAILNWLLKLEIFFKLEIICLRTASSDRI
jgi:hypothetical protein